MWHRFLDSCFSELHGHVYESRTERENKCMLHKGPRKQNKITITKPLSGLEKKTWRMRVQQAFSHILKYEICRDETFLGLSALKCFSKEKKKTDKASVAKSQEVFCLGWSSLYCCPSMWVWNFHTKNSLLAGKLWKGDSVSASVWVVLPVHGMCSEGISCWRKCS